MVFIERRTTRTSTRPLRSATTWDALLSRWRTSGTSTCICFVYATSQFLFLHFVLFLFILFPITIRLLTFCERSGITCMQDQNVYHLFPTSINTGTLIPCVRLPLVALQVCVRRRIKSLGLCFREGDLILIACAPQLTTLH